MNRGWWLRWLVTGVAATVRYRISDPHKVLELAGREPVIFVFWHNRIFLMPHLFRRYWRRRGRHQVAVLISRSRDGQLLADVLAAFQLRCVRGSSSRGGAEALRELAELVREGFDIGITPDGPRGPRYVLQPGCVRLAELTGAPIVPVGYQLSHKLTLRSWDAFQVPIPFARCEVRLGAPVRVAAVSDDTTREAKRREVESMLWALCGETPSNLPQPSDLASSQKSRNFP
ncbi:MAG: lysophospholipid acyltransferase family protein [Verrucomicrobiae bacterium]|nr:lysophospholipid acyltransferase family protein [Verrucomicrobiae bacterium]